MFFSRNKSKLGIDIGTTSIKAVQLRQEAGGFYLESYGMVNVSYPPQADNTDFDVISETAKILKELLARSQVTTKKAVVSLPNNIVFVSMIEMPKLSTKELKDAIEWEARRYVPLPLEEVTLSWSVLEEETLEKSLKVLLTAVPTTVIDNYLKMFKLAGLTPLALEIEALALIRSLIGRRKDSFLLVDIGARNTSLNLVDKGFLRLSRNLAVGGETLTQTIAKNLNISFMRAEQFKKDLSQDSATFQEIPKNLKLIIDTIKEEAVQLLKIFEVGGTKIQEVIFCGAGAQFPKLVEYFSDLDAKVVLGDALQFIAYSPEVKENLSQVSPGLAVALGLAMRN